MKLTADDWDELAAIHEVVRQTGVPTFQHKSNWDRLWELEQAGLVELGPHEDFSGDFKAVSLTHMGMFKLRQRLTKSEAA